MKRLLLISYYYPPAGGSGVQRVLRTTQHLPESGWHPTVLTADPDRASLPNRDDDLLGDVPEGIRVVRTAGWEPHRLYARWTDRTLEQAVRVGFASDTPPGGRERVARWVRANLFLPDARIGWALAARRVARREAARESFDAVLSSGPPHSAHLAARAVARRFGIPWIVDFRDLWPDPNYVHQLPTLRPAAALDSRFRRSVLGEASAVVTVSRPMAETLRSETRAPVHVIENGFEEADFAGVVPDAHEGFVLLHAGSLPSERNPTALWSALDRLSRAGGIDELRVELLGHTDSEVLRGAEHARLSDRLRVLPMEPHADAVRRMAGADALLLPLPRVPGAEGIVTGKLFEYIGAGRPVLGIGPPEGEAARIMKAARAGNLFDYEDASGIEAYLRTLYGAWRRGEPHAGSPPDVAVRFTRKARTEQLAALLDTIVKAA